MRAFYIPNRVYKSGGRLIVQNASGTFYSHSKHLKPFLKYLDEDKIYSSLTRVSDYRLLFPSVNWVLPEDAKECVDLLNGFEYSQPVIKTPFGFGVVWLPTFEITPNNFVTDAEHLSYSYERQIAVKTCDSWFETSLEEKLDIYKDSATLKLREVVGNNLCDTTYTYITGVWNMTSCQYLPIHGLKEL